MEKNLYELTTAQNSIWLTEQFGSNTNINNIGGYVFIHEKVDFSILKRALALYVKRNDALNFRITLVDGKPKQYLYESNPCIEHVHVENMDEVIHLNEEIIHTPFSIIDSNLYHIVMFELPNGLGGFNATLHHIISDAWNMSLLISEVMNVYSQLLKEEVSFDAFPSYFDYVSAEQEYFHSSRFQKDSEFWNSIFNTQPELSYIVPDVKENVDTTSRRKIFELDPVFYDQVSCFCRENGCSIYTFFMSIYSTYLAKVNNTHTPIIGTPVLNRSNYKEKHTAGMFISTVPFKIEIDLEINFKDFLKLTATRQLSIFRHQKYPYSKLLEDVKTTYGISENLYDLVLSYQNARDDKNESDINYTSNWLFTGHTLDTLEIHFYDMDNTGILKLYYDYQIAKLNEEAIIQLHNRIIEMTKFILKNPDVLMKDIEVITPKEKERLLTHFNYTSFDFDTNYSFVSLFEEQVRNHPNKIAAIFENETLTYQDLNQKANQLSHLLIKNHISCNQVVGIMLPRSLDILIAIWAVLKSGAGYMLIDTSLPEDRIQYMLSTADCPFLITNDDISIEFEQKIFINQLPDNLYSVQNPKVQTNNEDTFCVIFTSGSTGTPKGVELKKIGVLNMLYSYKHFLYTDTCDTFLSTSTVAFDMFIVENFVSLLSGKTVILANDEEQKVPVFMSNLIKKYDVDFILSTPSKIELLLLNEDIQSCLKNVKVIQLGGEVFKENLYRRLRSCTNANIFDGYGPSECTACCSNKEIMDGNSITIGKPFLNTNIYLLNSDMNLLPIGYTGEICVSGLGVGKGYINRPELTEKVFVKDPFSDRIMYRTGDMGKYQEDGNLIYLGRKDAQVKLRGLRIELDEITNKILGIDGITNAVCVIKKVNDIDCICSYVIRQNSSITEEFIKDTVRQVLPYYMVPSHVLFLESLPITLNGKIDLKKLPDVVLTDFAYIAPQSETELALSKIWCRILGISKISTQANFFDLGGDSLCSIKLVSEVYSELKVKISIRDIFRFPTIASLAEQIDHLINNYTEENKIEKAPSMDSYPLSSAQKRIYYASQISPEAITYNTSGGLFFDEIPDVQKLENCFVKLIKKHSALRSYFVLENDMVVQKVQKNISFHLDVISVNDKDIDSLFQQFVKPFDLSKAPLLRTVLYAFPDKSAVLFIDMHHIICDGESISIFVDDLCHLYNGENLTKSSIEYVDYAVWEQNQIASPSYLKSESFWLKQFEDEIPLLNMPTNFTRPNVQSFDGSKVYGKIENSEEIFSLCKQLNTTPYMFLLSIYYILLYKYTLQKDIVVGSPIVGRNHADVSSVIGMFVNTLALRIKLDTRDTFDTFLQYLTNYCFNAFENQAYPFDELINKLNLSRDTSRNPLFDTMFIYQNNGEPEIHLDGLKTSYYIPDNHTSKFDFSLEISPEDNHFNLTLEYCTKLFEPAFMENFLQHYLSILNIIMKNVHIPLSEINMLSGSECLQVLHTFNSHVLDYPANKSIIELFEKQAKLHPDTTAILCHHDKLSYRQLEKQVSCFSAYLISIGVKKGDIVCTLLTRSTSLIVSMLAIMKCGAIYLPISTTFPIDRIQYITDNSKAKFVITDSHLYIENLKREDFSLKFVDIDQVNYADYHFDQKISYLPNDVIYTIYTSGSTGAPKGVQIMNQNLNNFIHSFKELFENSVTSKDICLATTSISFDVSIWEFFFTLLNGATLYLYEKESIEDIFDYCNSIIQNQITMAYIPPNILTEVYSVLAENKEVKLDKILLGVEPIKSRVVQNFFELNPHMKIVNGYGPTETTICTTAFPVKKSNVFKYNIIPIGQPLHNLHAFVLDCDLNPLPIGIPGELYICGDNVGKGYLNNPELTNQKYIPCPFVQGQLMYNTGDIVKWMPDGNLMFVGRNDGQIKIKGHRVELNEINNAILSYPTITKSVVIVKEENENKFLVAYFTANKKVILNDLRSFLTLKLPFYNIPNFLVQLDKFALTANGKIDSHYLRNLDVSYSSYYEAPKTDFEKQLANLWQDFLGVEKIGINDNFFELGGDSLIAIKLQIEAFKLGINVSYSDIFSYPTIKQLSHKISVDTHKIDISSFDYQNINTLISHNTTPISSCKTIELTDVLLTGVTGFVGIHILDSLLTHTNATIHCLVRSKNNVDYVSRLIKTMQFYFGDKYNTLVGNRIHILEGDITSKHFGLSEEMYQEIGNKVSCVINSAAIVKHFGRSSLFDRTNIQGVQNIVDFCECFGVKLYHISTLSVSGNVFAEDSFNGAIMDKKVTFKENHLYVGQDLSNIYIYTKFMAERLILDNIASGKLKGCIIRLGNITSRYSDGQFQINVSENAFLNRLNSFIQLKCIPDYLMSGYTEFTPVDCCANAISKIVTTNCDYTIFHLYNNNHISITDIISILKEYGMEIDVVDHDTFLKVIDMALQNDKNILSGIINDFDVNKHLVYQSNISLNNDFTNAFLHETEFNWPEINQNYIFKYLDYLKNIGYIK